MARVDIDQDRLRRVAGGTHFARGSDYHLSGRVRSLAIDDLGATAVVDGTRPYRVRLAIRGETLLGDCNCPMGDDGVFCKHCVATGLAWVQAAMADPSATGVADAADPTDDDLRNFLLTQEREWLADLLLEAAAEDPVLRARLLVSAGAEAVESLDLSDFEAELEQAILIEDFVDWRGTATYLRDVDVDVALGRVEDLIEAGFTDAAIALCEHALVLLEESVEMIDDSDGGMKEAIGRAEQIHLRACLEGSPDRVALAERLADWALRSKWEVFLDAVPRYAGVLGPDGLARFRQIVDAAWSGLPPLAPGDHSTYGDGRFQVTYQKEALAALDGDVVGLVAVRAHDLSSPYAFLRVAEVLVGAGRDDEALDWLERGVATFPDRRDPRLTQLAAECHLRAGRGAAAVGLAWEIFQQHPSLERYQRLREYATADDTWTRWREQALDTLRARPKADPAKAERLDRPGSGHSTLVEVLVWEGELDAAWAAAQHGGCSEGMWLELARLRAADHPRDALPVLHRHIGAAIEVKNRRGYRHAVDLLTELHAIYEAAGDGAGFAAYVRSLRAQHARKRAFVEELDRARLPR